MTAHDWRMTSCRKPPRVTTPRPQHPSPGYPGALSVFALKRSPIVRAAYGFLLSAPWLSSHCSMSSNMSARVQLAVLAMKIVIVLGDLGAVALVVVKQNPRAEELIVMNRNFVVTQVVFNAVLLFALLSGFVVWVARVASSYRHGMMWTKRRTGVAQVWPPRHAFSLPRLQPCTSTRHASPSRRLCPPCI